MAETKPCRSCGKQCTLARTAATGKWMPLEEDSERGNVLIDEMGRAHAFRDHATAVAELEAEPERWSTVTFISHHARCPQGAAWRARSKPKPKPKPKTATEVQERLDV